jgi:hypothetical protein
VSRSACIVLAVSLTVLLGACAGGRPGSAPASQAQVPGGGTEHPAARAEIARLWDEIDAWRGQPGATGMSAQDVASSPESSEAEAASSTHAPAGESAAPGLDPALAAAAIAPPDAACPATVSEPPQCRDSCTLATSICSNAERICRLAEELAGDDWAAGKCADAAAVCRQATTDCCDCRAGT